MGRLETQQRGDNVCILKGWNAILQQAASGYEMNNDKHSYYCWIEPKYNELFEPKFIHQNANLAPLH